MLTRTLPAPFRPFPLRVANAIGRGADRFDLDLIRLDASRLVAGASQSTGLSDFGDPSFRSGLARLVESLERDAQLTLFGRYFARRQIRELLRHRLQLVEHRRQAPDVARQEIRRPLFVLGLPRTGTTLLYSLLAVDPAHRSPLSWEIDDPYPPPESDSYDSDPRIRRTERRFEQLRQLAPGFQAIHPIGALLPQECIVLTASEFMSLRFEMCFDVSGYQEWMLEQDMTPAYRHHRRFLQHLQSRCPKERWILKSPGHLGPIDALFDVYPDAMIVQTHRDPLRVIPSVSSLEYTMRGIASDAVDPRSIGRQQLRGWSTLLRQGMEARQRSPERAGRFLDLHFHEILANPLECVRRIYTHFDLPLSSETEARMRAHLSAHPRDEHGVHEYHLSDFGLDPEAIRGEFKSYCDRFGVEPEPVQGEGTL